MNKEFTSYTSSFNASQKFLEDQLLPLSESCLLARREVIMGNYDEITKWFANMDAIYSTVRAIIRKDTAYNQLTNAIEVELADFEQKRAFAAKSRTVMRRPVKLIDKLKDFHKLLYEDLIQNRLLLATEKNIDSKKRAKLLLTGANLE